LHADTPAKVAGRYAIFSTLDARIFRSQ